MEGDNVASNFTTEGEVEEYIKKTISSQDVAVFSKSWCPFCKKVKSILEEQNMKAWVLELDVIKNEELFQSTLYKLTSQKTVPSVFIKGQHVGGCSDTEEAVRTGIMDEWRSGVVKKFEYDLFVIGGGPGGLPAAREAVKFNKKVGLADFVVPSPRGATWDLGGTCINVGCIPKKLMHRAALINQDIADAPNFGWKIPHGVHHKWEDLVSNVSKYIRSRNEGFKNELIELGIPYFNSLATLKDRHTVRLIDNNSREKEVTAKAILLAVGGRPNLPSIPGARELCITSDDFFFLSHDPGKVLVVGASYVALECAGLLRGLGHEVTVMVRSILLRGFDRGVSEKIGENMAGHGIEFIYGCVPTSVTEVSKGLPPTLAVEGKFIDGRKYSCQFNTVLFATGRSPATGSLGLDRLGVKLKDGFIQVDAEDRTSVANLFAVGDVALDKPQLTPVALMAGKLLVHRLFGGSSVLMDYTNVATTVFTPLEYGCVGYSEEAALATFPPDSLVVYHTAFTPLETTLPERLQNECYLKLICLKEDGPLPRVIGLHVLGPNAGEITQGFALAIKVGVTKQQFDLLVGIHPTCAEELTKVVLNKVLGEDLAKKKVGC